MSLKYFLKLFFMSVTDKKEKIREFAYSLGFDACGFASAGKVDCENALSEWLSNGYAASMNYMHNHFEKRCDPRLLVEGAKSVIVVALNYYPSVFQPENHPQFSYYAYGQDYHEVMKEKLRKLFEFINNEIQPVSGRMFVDSAPVLERYWAVKAGLGFIGKNTLLIIPGKGSFFFLGEIISDLDIEPDAPLNRNCGSCDICIKACPGSALTPYCLNAEKCISFQTIENREDLSEHCKDNLGNRVYGCDICQKSCHHNARARSEERRVGKECLSLGSYRWWPYN